MGSILCMIITQCLIPDFLFEQSNGKVQLLWTLWYQAIVKQENETKCYIKSTLLSTLLTDNHPFPEQSNAWKLRPVSLVFDYLGHAERFFAKMLIRGPQKYWEVFCKNSERCSAEILRCSSKILKGLLSGVPHSATKWTTSLRKLSNSVCFLL